MSRSPLCTARNVLGSAPPRESSHSAKKSGCEKGGRDDWAACSSSPVVLEIYEARRTYPRWIGEICIEGGGQRVFNSHGVQPAYVPRTSDRNSARVTLDRLNCPRMALVTMRLPGFLTPRMVMQRCSASTTTATPSASSDSMTHSATWLVSRFLQLRPACK